MSKKKHTNNSPKNQILYLKPSEETKEREQDRDATKARATGANVTDIRFKGEI